MVRAARFYGVPPWELLKQPLYWMQLAMIVEPAEAEADAILAKKARDKASQNKRH